MHARLYSTEDLHERAADARTLAVQLCHGEDEPRARTTGERSEQLSDQGEAHHFHQLAAAERVRAVAGRSVANLLRQLSADTRRRLIEEGPALSPHERDQAAAERDMAAHYRDWIADQRKIDADKRDRIADERDHAADERGRRTEHQQRHADERERLLNEREHLIAERERIADERDQAASPQARQPPRSTTRTPEHTTSQAERARPPAVGDKDGDGADLLS
ncbi:hypothetical protein GCM10009872_62570 [Actinopolymorpha rutila]